VLVVASLSLSACSASARYSSSVAASTTTLSPSGLVPALATHNPAVSIRPSTGFVDGQQVTVTVRGFGQGGKFFLSECASSADVSSLGCGAQLAAQPFGVTDDTGSGSFPFTVHTSARAGPSPEDALVACRDACVLVATVGDGYGYGYGYGYAYAHLIFRLGS